MKGHWGQAFYGSVLHFWPKGKGRPKQGRYERKTLCGKWLVRNPEPSLPTQRKCPKCEGKYAKFAERGT